MRFGYVVTGVALFLGAIGSLTPTARGDSWLPLRDSLQVGNYEYVLHRAADILESAPERIEIAGLEVRAGILAGTGEEYVSRILSDTSTSFLSDARRVLVLCEMGRYREAQAVLDGGETGADSSAWAVCLRGRVAEGLGRLSVALESFRKAQTDSTVRSHAMYREASLLSRCGQWSEADSLLAELSAIAEYEVLSQVKRASGLGWRGDWASCARQGQEIAERSNSAYGYDAWIRSLFVTGREAEAWEAVNRCLERWPRNKGFRVLAAHMAGRLGYSQKQDELVTGFSPLQRAYCGANQKAERAATINDTLAFQSESRLLGSMSLRSHQRLLSYLQWLKDRHRTAEVDSVLDVVARKGSPVVEAILKGELIAEDDPEAALRIIDSLVPEPDCLPDVLTKRIAWLHRAGHVEQAHRIANQFLQHTPGQFDLYDAVVVAELSVNQYDTAEEWIDRWERVLPGHTRLRLLRLFVLMSRNELARARALLDSVSHQSPVSPDWLLLAGSLYDDEESVDSLRSFIEPYLSHQCMGAKAVVDLATILITTRDYHLADSLLSEAIQRDSAGAELYYRRGLVSTYAGDFQKAQADLKRATELDPYQPEYNRALRTATNEGSTVERFSEQTDLDTVGLEYLSVDSLLTLAANTDSLPDLLGARILLDRWQYIYHDRSRMVRRVHRAILVTSEQGIDRHVSQSYSFNALAQTPRLVLARTIHPDGTVDDVPSDKAYVGSGYGDARSDARQINWSFPKVDSGVILDMIIQFEGTQTEALDLYEWSPLQEFDPVAFHETELRVPSQWPIMERHSEGVTLERTTKQGLASYVWRATNLGPLKYEEDCPSLFEQSEWVHFAYEKTWPQEAEWYWNKIKSKVDTTESIAQLARELTRDLSNDEDRIRALYRHVADKINYVEVSLGEGTIVPRPPQTTLDNGYGDCKDKTTLLLSLFQCLGIEAYAALISSADETHFDSAIANIGQFDHVVAFLPHRQPRFLDATCDICSAGDLVAEYRGKPVLVIGSDFEEPLIRTPEATSNDNTYAREVRIVGRETGGVDIDVAVTITGHTAAILKANLRTADSSGLRSFIESQSSSGLPASSRMTRHEVGKHAQPGFFYHWDAHFSADSVCMKSLPYGYVPASFSSLGSMLTIPDATGRELDVDIGSRFCVTDRFVIVPGDRWELFNNRLSWNWDTTWFSVSSTAEEWDDSLALTIDFVFKTTRIPVGELPSLMRTIDHLDQRIRYQSWLFRQRPDSGRIARLEKAIEENPGDVSLIVSLVSEYLGDDDGGEGCRGSKYRQKAIELLQEATTLRPTHEMLTMQLAIMLGDEVRYAEADSVLAAFVARGNAPLLIQALRSATVTELGRWEESRDLLEKHLDQMPSDETRLLLINTYTRLGLHDEAERQISLLETLEADSTVLMQGKLLYSMETENWEEAMEIVDAWPDTSSLLRNTLKASVYETKDDYREAIEILRQTLDEYPDNSLLLNAYAWNLALLDSNLTQALDMADRALVLAGDCDYAVRNTRGAVLLAMGRVDEAEQEFRASMADQSASHRTVNLYFLGRCAAMKDRPDEAAELFAEAARLNGDKRFAGLAREALDESK